MRLLHYTRLLKRPQTSYYPLEKYLLIVRKFGLVPDRRRRFKKDWRNELS